MMEVRLPNLGEDADSGTVATVFVTAGDRIEKDQPLIELESEKAVASVPAPQAGTVTAVHVKEGDEVRTGSLLVTLETGDGIAVPAKPKTARHEAGSSAAAEEAGDGRENEPSPARPKLGPRSTKPESPRASEAPPELPEGVAPAASPTIRKLARDLGIDLTRVRGTARGGRIVLGDLRDYIARLEGRAQAADRSPASPARTEPTPPPSIDFSRWGPVETVRTSAIRKTIATRMVESWTRVPHVTQFADAGIDRLMELRGKHIEAYKTRGARLTLTPILLRALVRTLARHPLLNSSLDEAAASIVEKRYYHIGLAVDTEAGLIVPVIRDVDRKSMFQLAREVEELSERARQRKATREDLQGGTFTVSNQGGIGGAYFTPIINYPEVAILGVGRGREMVRMVDGEPQARLMLPLAVSHDHRVVDGADGVRFLTDLVREIEDLPESEFELK
jgi:pyruvate dehydrogenase E2 component (dihydrolipoyllysine-residue acetyltransferase)